VRRLFGDAEDLGDFPVGLSGRHPFEAFALTRRGALRGAGAIGRPQRADPGVQIERRHVQGALVAGRQFVMSRRDAHAGDRAAGPMDRNTQAVPHPQLRQARKNAPLGGVGGRMIAGPAKRGRVGIHAEHGEIASEIVLGGIVRDPFLRPAARPAGNLARQGGDGRVADAEGGHAEGLHDALERRQQGRHVLLTFKMLYQLQTGIGKQHRHATTPARFCIMPAAGGKNIGVEISYRRQKKVFLSDETFTKGRVLWNVSHGRKNVAHGCRAARLACSVPGSRHRRRRQGRVR